MLYCNEHVPYVCLSVMYMCVCLSVREHISRTTCAIFTKFFVHVAYGCGDRAAYGGVTKSQGESAILGVFFPIDNALHSLEFGTHTKTDEPIEMPFGLMTRVGPRYHVLDGGPDPPREGAILGKRIAAHCKVTGTLYGALCKNG